MHHRLLAYFMIKVALPLIATEITDVTGSPAGLLTISAPPCPGSRKSKQKTYIVIVGPLVNRAAFPLRPETNRMASL